MLGIPCSVSPCMMLDGSRGICLDVAVSGPAARTCVPVRDMDIHGMHRELDRAEELIIRNYYTSDKTAAFRLELAFPAETLTKCCFVLVVVPKNVTRCDVIYAFEKAHEYLDERLTKDGAGPYAEDGREPCTLAQYVAKEKGWKIGMNGDIENFVKLKFY